MANRLDNVNINYELPKVNIKIIKFCMITSAQLRAARALLGWSQDDLATNSGASKPTIARLELMDGEIGGYPSTREKLTSALEAGGVIFVPGNGDGPGVRLRKVAPTHAELDAHIDTLHAGLPEVDPHAKPSPAKGMKQLERAHAKNEIAKATRKRAKAKGRGEIG